MKQISILILLAAILLPSPLEAKTLSLKDYPIVIGCKNIKTWKFVDPKNSSIEDGACLIWPNMKNMMLPSKPQMKLLKEVFKDKAAIITAITIINHESQFNSKAKWCHKWGCDYGLLQIRDVNGGKKMTDKQQMEWFRDRKASQLKKWGNCSHRLKDGQEATLRCVFARHNWVLNGQAKYPTQRYQEWKFYNEYFWDYSFK